MKKIIEKNLLIYLMGANGFPIAMYKPIMNQLQTKVIQSLQKKEYELNNSNTISIKGSDVFHKINKSKDWTPMIDLLVNNIEKEQSIINNNNNNLITIGVGHSFGGGLLCSASARNNKLLNSLILIEPPIFSPYIRFLWSLALRLPTSIVYSSHPMIIAALKKQDKFTSLEEAKSYLLSKRLFSSFHPDVFHLYIKECIIKSEKELYEYEMYFNNSMEAQVYHKVPTEIPYFSSSLVGTYNMKKSGYFLTTNHRSSILKPFDKKWIENELCGNNKFNYISIDKNLTHMWPLENPDHFSDYISNLISELIIKENTKI
jgi:hypothetical protein